MTETYTSDVIGKPRVLVAEDDGRLAGMLDSLLASEGFEVSRAADGQRALHLGLSGEFDVSVLDRGLPAVEGLDVLRRLREHGVTTPILVLSALGTAPDRVDGLNAGAEDYLAKPFDIDELVARVRALTRRAAAVVPTVRFPGGRIDTGSRNPAGNTCDMGAFPQKLKVGHRRYVIDETLGAVSIFHDFPWLDAGLPVDPGTPASQMFRIEGGKTRYIHEVTVCTTPGCGRARPGS